MNDDAPDRPRGGEPRRAGSARRRSRYEQERGDNHWLRMIVIVGAIGLAAAVLLFWRGRDEGFAGGIGERFTVVTTDSSGTPMTRPRSGSVEIGQHETPLVPENSDGTATASARRTEAAPVRANRESEPAAAAAGPGTGGTTQRSTPPREIELPARPAAGDAASTSAPEPRADGRWAVQIGAFGSEENAQALAQQLSDEGFAPRLHADSGASGEIIHRVWIGYFESREDAQRYARAHVADLGDGFPVRR